MTKSLIVALAALCSFACSAAVDQEGAELGETSEQALGIPSLSCPTTLTLKTSLASGGVGAIGRSRSIRAGMINNAVFCAASGDPVPVRTTSFGIEANRSMFADLIGSVQASAEGGDFVFRLRSAGITLQTKRVSCPTESFSTSASGWNTVAGTATASAAILSSSGTHFTAQCTYTATASSVRVSRVKPSNVFAALGSSFYAKSELTDTQLRNVCSTNCTTQCTSNIPSGTHLDGVGECIQNCTNSCVIR